MNIANYYYSAVIKHDYQNELNVIPIKGMLPVSFLFYNEWHLDAHSNQNHEQQQVKQLLEIISLEKGFYSDTRLASKEFNGGGGPSKMYRDFKDVFFTTEDLNIGFKPKRFGRWDDSHRFLMKFGGIFDKNGAPLILALIENDVKKVKEFRVSCLDPDAKYDLKTLKYVYDSAAINNLPRCKFKAYLVEFLKYLQAGFVTEDIKNLYGELYEINALPVLKSVHERKAFFKTVVESYLANTPLEAKFKRVIMPPPSVQYVRIIEGIKTTKKEKKLITYTIEKSQLATLMGLNYTPKEIAEKIGVEEQDIKDVAIKLGLIKSRKAPAKYIINVVEDI